jgi:hypothetical protein
LKLFRTPRNQKKPSRGFVIALGLALLVSGCATKDPDKPQHRSDRKWWQGDMDNQDRAFFIDSFFDGNGR